MKSFLEHIKEEVLPSVQVADGGLDIEKPAVRAAINAAIAGVVSQPAVTPYVVFNRLSKLLAQYHIVLPRKFLEGDKGVEVFEIRQFGHKMGMTDSGEFINQVPTTHYLFLQYGIITPMGVTYAKPLVGGMFRVTARLVDRVELDRLLDMAEITMSEEAECRQNAAKAMAPKDPMHDVTSDPKKVGNKKAVATSEKKSLDEDKGPCWKGYEMVGMKKKAGKPVPNCVPVKEESIEEGQVTGPRSYKGSPDRKRKAVQMALGRKHKDHPEWNDRTNPQYSALKLGRKLQKQGVTEEKGDRLTPGFGNRKDFDTVAKEIGTGKGGMTIVDKAPKGGESSSQTIYPMSPKSGSRAEPDDVARKMDKTTPGNPQAERNSDLDSPRTVKESAPPGREKQVLALKKKFPKGSGSPFAIAWSSYKKSHSE